MSIQKLAVAKWFVMFFLLQTVFACGQKTFEEMANDMAGKTPVVQASSLQNELGKVVLLDARELPEYNVSHIKGARFIGYDDFNLKAVTDIPKDARVVVYCSVGYRSGKVVEKMQKAGYTNVVNLWGGIFNWVNAGNFVENESGLTNHIHPYNEKWGKWLSAGEKVYE
jgi:rhodanese-related sulfurtransferase